METFFENNEEITEQDQELTTKSILALFETDRAQRKSFVDDIIHRLDEGEVNPLVVLLQAKCMDDILTQLMSTDKEKNKNLEASTKFKKHIAEAFTNNAAGQKSFGFHNATFRQMEAGTKYDFSKCNDPEWDNLNSQIEDLVAKRKKKEEFLKTVPLSGVDMRFDDEMITVYPPSKTSTTTIAVSLK